MNELLITPTESPLGATVHGFGEAVAGAASLVGVAERVLAAVERYSLLIVPAFGSGDSLLDAVTHMLGSTGPTRPHSTITAIGCATQNWHVDESFMATIPRLTVMAAIDAPNAGGQTAFADMATAWNLLPPEEQALLANAVAVHQHGDHRPVEHRMMQVGTDGTRSLLVGAHADHIVDWPVDEGRQKLAELAATLTVHDIVHEHRWLQGDLVIWNNRTVMHRHLPWDHANQTRTMRRTLIR